MAREAAPVKANAAGIPVVTPREVELLRALSARGGAAVESELRGGSMGAALPEGTRIRIGPTGAGFSPGQVVAFLANSRVMVHRVVYVGQGLARGYLVTQGDGNWLCDPPIERDAVAGCVAEFLAEEGWRPVGPASVPAPRRLVAAASLAFTRGLLALHPPAALAAARVMSRVRMAVRGAWLAVLSLVRRAGVRP